jgi:hypothetical protein
MTADANAGALDAGLDTALVFVDMCPVNILRQIADAVCSNVVDKAFGTRANTLSKLVFNIIKAKCSKPALICVSCLFFQGQAVSHENDGGGRSHHMREYSAWQAG